MIKCRKGPASRSKTHRLQAAAGREKPAMSVIVEEPPSMRESRLSEREKHPDDIKPSNDSIIDEFTGRSQKSTRGSNVQAPPAPKSMSKTGSAFSSTLTTSSSSDELHNLKALQNQLQSSLCAGPSSNQSSDSRTRYSEALKRYERTRRTLPSRLEHEYPRHSNASNSPSLEKEKERYDDYGRPYRQNTTSQASDTYLNTLSTRQPKASAASKSERCQSPLDSSPVERLGSIPSSSSSDMDVYHGRVESRHASQSRLRAQERCCSMSSSSLEVHGKRQLPSFRRPNRPVGDDIPSSTSSSEQTSAEERVYDGMPSRPLSSPRDSPRMRLTSLLAKKPPTSASSREAIPPRSPTVLIFPALASASPLETSSPGSPLRLRHYEGRFLNRRSQTLFYFSLFPPEKMRLRGVVLYLHGLGDHCRRNVNMYERLCREGFGVITYDLLNHGVSDLDQQKTRAHISDFTHLVEDTNDFITFAKRSLYMDALRYWRKHHQRCHLRGQKSNPDMILLPELPLIIAGTSFGSLIGIHTILSSEHDFHAAVWGSPTIGVTWNPLLWAESKLAKPLAAVMPTAKLVPAIQYDLLCRDPKFLRRFKADPLTSMDMITTRTGHESLQAMIQLQEDERITDSSSAFCAIPMLFLAGSADGISDQQAAIKFFSTMGNFDKEFKLFDGLFHMVYEEPEKEDVLRHLIQWLHRRFPDE